MIWYVHPSSFKLCAFLFLWGKSCGQLISLTLWDAFRIILPIYSHHPPICTEYHITAFHKLLQSKKNNNKKKTLTQYHYPCLNPSALSSSKTNIWPVRRDTLFNFVGWTIGSSNPLPWGPLVSCVTCFPSHFPVSYICTDDIKTSAIIEFHMHVIIKNVLFLMCKPQLPLPCT